MVKQMKLCSKGKGGYLCMEGDVNGKGVSFEKEINGFQIEGSHQPAIRKKAISFLDVPNEGPLLILLTKGLIKG